MQDKHLIGFYRDDKTKKITEIYSHTPYFHILLPDQDTKKKNTSSHINLMKAIIVPLALRVDTEKWTLTEDAAYLPKHLQKILNDGAYFMTCKKETSPFYILMHTQAKDTKMCRGGTLLRRIKNDYYPEIVTINKREYIIEIKGVGSPSGEFSSVHLRSLAPGFGGHVRLTGVFSKAGAHFEYDNLESFRDIYNSKVIPQNSRALGVKDYTVRFSDYENNYGQLLRLSASSIRFSTSGSISLKTIKPLNFSTIVHQFGFYTALLIENVERPLIHDGLNIDNMIFINPTTYVFTDSEEMTFLGEIAKNLDLPQIFLPEFLHNRHLQNKHSKDFIDGFKSFPGRLQKQSKTHTLTSIKDLNHFIFKTGVGKAMFNYRLETAPSFEPIKKNIHRLKTFLPPSYTKLSMYEWIKTDFYPLLEKKVKILDFYIEFEKKYGQEKLIEGTSQSETPNESSLLINEIKTIFPDFPQLIKSHDMKAQDDGNYHSLYTYENQFIYFSSFVSCKEELSQRKNHLLNLISICKDFLDSKTFPLESELKQVKSMNFLEDFHDVHFFSLLNNSYPFFTVLWNYYHNEEQVINGALNDSETLSKNEKNTALSLIEKISQKRNYLIHNLEEIKTIFLQDEERFIKTCCEIYH